jgi:hypothetical protein
MLFRRVLLTAAALLVLAAPHAARADMEDYPVVKLQSLDKITARTMTFEARVGSTLKYGPLYIKIQACRKAPPIEQPEAAAFLQIWEVTPENDAKWVFSGWMYASSPALSPMDHPVYDVWVLDCLQRQGGGEAEKSAAAGEKEAQESGAAASVPKSAPPADKVGVAKPGTEKPGDDAKMQIRETAPGTGAPATKGDGKSEGKTSGSGGEDADGEEDHGAATPATPEDIDAEHAAETEGQED